MLRSSYRVSLVVIFALVVSVLSAGCGGGGLSINLTPNPPGGNQNLVKSPTPAITIAAMISGGNLIVDAAPGTFGPGAEVVMRDITGMEVHDNAAGDGSFSHVGFPPSFNQSDGSSVRVSQIISGMSESDPRPIIIVTIMGP